MGIAYALGMVGYGKREIAQRSLLWGIHMRATTAIEPNSSGSEKIISNLGHCRRWEDQDNAPMLVICASVQRIPFL